MDFIKLWDCDEGRMSSTLWREPHFSLIGWRATEGFSLTILTTSKLVMLSPFPCSMVPKRDTDLLSFLRVMAIRFHNSSIIGHHYEKNSKRRKKWEDIKKMTNWLQEPHWSDGLPVSSAQCIAEGSSNISIPVPSKKKMFFLHIFGPWNPKSCINLWNGLIDKVKYKSGKEKSSCTMLFKDQRVKIATVFKINIFIKG